KVVTGLKRLIHAKDGNPQSVLVASQTTAGGYPAVAFYTFRNDALIKVHLQFDAPPPEAFAQLSGGLRHKYGPPAARTEDEVDWSRDETTISLERRSTGKIFVTYRSRPIATSRPKVSMEEIAETL